ncbi:MAG: DUF4838 domain-containing protein [Bacteroidales bacterium]|nr:DUF4838 domain-containing protein [Bacteroidales bacterium]
MRRLSVLFLALLALLTLALTSCGNHKLFRNGKSEYTIILSPDATESERYAAEELRYWIKEVSWTDLPLADLSGGVRGKRLVVGFNPLVSEMVPEAVKPEDRDDSFTVRSVGGDILFWGGSLRGTLYAVYSFLEEELGCRWYSSKVSVAPHKDVWSFNKLDRHEEPGIKIRDNCVLDVRSNPVFSARTRNNFVRLPGNNPGETIPGTAEGYWGVHAMGYLVSPAEFYSTHPEYFSMRDGKRVPRYAQLCLSNPEVLDICIDRIKDVMRREPDYLIYSVEQNDNQEFCQCDECTALAEKYGGQSGLMVWFVNQVADAVKEEFPDKYIGTFAYQYTRHAPKDIAPRDNVVIRLCSIECCMFHEYDDCELNVDFLKDLRDWSAIAPHLYIWDYVTDFAQYSLPVANWKTMGPHIKDFRDNNAIGILEEGDYQTVSCELREMRSWLLAKLMWNPDADVDALIKDFTDGYYGAAGPFIREYLELEDSILRRPGIHSDCYISASDPMYTNEFIFEGRKIFAAAKEAVASDQILYDRVETAEMPLCLLLMQKNPIVGFQEGADDLVRSVVEREGIDRMAEGEWSGGVVSAKRLMEQFDRLEKGMKEAPEFPAADVKATIQGVAYKKYEGPFMSTSQMLTKGKLVNSGIMPWIGIDNDPDNDHFGYVFDCWFKAEQDGVHQFTVVSDDGAVLLIDGSEVLDIDGSHSVQTGLAMVNLAKGLHRFTLRYFEDCEGQSLDIYLAAPDGYNGHLPASRLFTPNQ